MNLDGLSIYSVPEKKARCYVCDEKRTCCHRDRDYGFYFVCMECSWFVIIAECLLLDLGFVRPGAAPSTAESIEHEHE